MPDLITNLDVRSLCAVLLGLIGLLLILWGERIFHLWLFSTGFFAGYSFALALNRNYLKLQGQGPLIFALVVAVALALLCVFAYRVSFFLAGGSLAAYYLSIFARLYAAKTPIPWIYILIASIIIGSLAAAFRKPFTRLATALCGAYLLCNSFYASLFNSELLAFLRGDFQMLRRQSPFIFTVLLIILTLIGTLYQSKKLRLK